RRCAAGVRADPLAQPERQPGRSFLLGRRPPRADLGGDAGARRRRSRVAGGDPALTPRPGAHIGRLLGIGTLAMLLALAAGRSRAPRSTGPGATTPRTPSDSKGLA